MKKEKVPLKAQLSEFGDKIVSFVSKYRVTLMIVVFGAVVGFSLFRSSTYSNVPRNETKFEELNTKSKVVKIDTDLIERIKESVDDDEPSIGGSPTSGRTNPFSE